MSQRYSDDAIPCYRYPFYSIHAADMLSKIDEHIARDQICLLSDNFISFGCVVLMYRILLLGRSEVCDA